MAEDVHRRLSGRHVLLLTDFDGTLSELASMPSTAVVSTHVRAEVAAISVLPSVTFGVVSGRRLNDVRYRIGGRPEFISGLHGLEIDGPDERFRHPALTPVVPAIANLLRVGLRTLSWCPGLYLEDKVYALTCHVRLSPPGMIARALDEFQALAEPQIKAQVLKALPGAKALEVLPSVDWHKGHAVTWIRDHVKKRVSAPLSVIYLGDDRTDEDAFSALGDDDVAIGVGERPDADLLDWRLAGPASVGRFLGHLAAALGEEPPA